MTSNPLIGTWRLISWENRDADGEISYPLGEDAVGYIMYNEDGYMFVAIMRPERDVCRRRSSERHPGGESARRQHLRLLLRAVRVSGRDGHPSCRAQPVSQLGWCR